MEYTTWHEHVYRKSVLGNKVHSKIEVTPFYQASLNKKDIGKYFGIGNGKNSFLVTDKISLVTYEVNGDLLIHNYTHTDSKPSGTISFDPKQEIFGARMDYFQDLFKGIFFKASLPIVQVKNDMGMKVADSVKVTPATGTACSLEDFFKGGINVSDVTSTDMQSPLTHAKIDGSRTATGVADIDLALGYKLFQSDKNHVYLNVGVTVPTGKESSGEYLFEPLYGNGHHFGLGGQFDAGIEIWHGKKASARVLLGVNYRYLFEDTENRTIGVTKSGEIDVLNHYYLVAKKGQAAATALIPAANVLTQGLKVKPGSMFDTMFALSFKCSGFVLDLGYNLFYKDKESVSLKNAWADDTYAFADSSFDTKNQFVVGTTGHALVKSTYINTAVLDLDVATNPSQLSHKVFGGLGYNCNIAKKYPVLIGLGGDYAFASENSTLETWAAWLKAGISF